jgi:large subunit ribosomal protein L15
MMLDQITRAAGAHRRRKRVGRGESSGRGKTSGRGNKGQQARAGGNVRPLTEGGQMPLFRRLPKRGFSNAFFRKTYAIVNLGTLEERFRDGATVDPDALRKLRLIPRKDRPVRILAKGTLTRRLTVAAHAFSAKARTLIEQAGGTVTVLARPQAPAAATERAGRAAAGAEAPPPAGSAAEGAAGAP